MSQEAIVWSAPSSAASLVGRSSFGGRSISGPISASALGRCSHESSTPSPPANLLPRPPAAARGRQPQLSPRAPADFAGGADVGWELGSMRSVVPSHGPPPDPLEAIRESYREAPQDGRPLVLGQQAVIKASPLTIDCDFCGRRSPLGVDGLCCGCGAPPERSS